MDDAIRGAAHYRAGSYEAADIIETFGLDWHLGNAVKYILRAGRKKGNPFDQDIRKAAEMLRRRIALFDEGPCAEVPDLSPLPPLPEAMASIGWERNQ